MPCAAAYLCLLLDRTLERPGALECRGKCGGRLHAICGEATIRAAEAIGEDQEDVVEDMRLDAVDDMTVQLSGTHVKGVNDDEKVDSDYDTTVRGAGGALPALRETLVAVRFVHWRARQ